MRNIQKIMVSLGLAVVLSGCETLGFDDENEEAVALDQVPEQVLSAAKSVVPGIEILEAEIERNGDEVVYELDGVLNDVEYEIEVSPEGEVLEIESSEDEEE